MPGCALGQSFDTAKAQLGRKCRELSQRWNAAVDNMPERPKNARRRFECGSELFRAALTDVRRDIRSIALELGHRHLRQDSIRHWNAPDQVAKGDSAGHGNLAELRMLLGGRLDRRLNGTREAYARKSRQASPFDFPPNNVFSKNSIRLTIITKHFTCPEFKQTARIGKRE